MPILLIQIISFIFIAPILGEYAEGPSDKTAWLSMDSNCFVIYYPPEADLKRIEGELEKRTLYLDQAARYGEVTASDEICYRLDKLFSRVKETLDMYPEMPKVKIKIFKDREGLDKEYFKILGKRGNTSSFYIYEYNTIYTSQSDIADSVMIHEMAHAIIDHYFSVVPPEKVAEALASYVDAHFDDSNPQ